MLVWINGPFGVGKTTTAGVLGTEHDDVRIFDPEIVGFMLRRYISEPIDDFQDWPAWRGLVGETAVELWRHYGGVIIAPMSLLHPAYAEEIFERLARQGIPQTHVVLHADEATLRERICGDQVETSAVDWRVDAIARYHGALPWLRDVAAIVDTTHLSPAAVAHAVEQAAFSTSVPNRATLTVPKATPGHPFNLGTCEEQP